MGLPPGGLMAFQRSKALLVSPEKNRIKEALRGVTLGGDSIDTIFPVEDYVSAEEHHHIGNNALKREPVLGLVSNTDVAVDIALCDPDIKLIIIDGASKIRSNYSGIERLNADILPRKIICLLGTVDEEEINTLAAMNIDSWVWKRADFRHSDIRKNTSTSTSEPFQLHDWIIGNLGGTAPDVIAIPSFLELDNTVKNFIDKVKKISNGTPSSEEAGSILRWGVSLINSLLQLPLTMAEYEAYYVTYGVESGLGFATKIKTFEEKFRSMYGFVIPTTNKEACEDLIKSLHEMYAMISLKNPKAKALDDYLCEHHDKKVTIACCRSEYVDACRKKYAHNDNIRVISMSEVVLPAEGSLVVTGWANRRLAAKLFLAPYSEIAYLVYERESRSYSQTLQSHPSSPNTKVDTKLREQNGESEDTPKTLAKTEDQNDVDVLLDIVNDKFGGPSYTDQLHGYIQVDMVDAHRIVFEDESYSYLTKTQGIDKLEREARTTKKCKLANVVSGDEIIFADSERDMFEELLAIIQESDEYKALSEKAGLWHRALTKYMAENDIDEEKLASQMELVGNRPDMVTIRAWIRGAVISPAKDYLRAIVKIVGDAELKDQIDEVSEACTRLHALHIQTGRLLVRRIIKAAANDDENILSSKTKEKLDEYSQKARVVTVRTITETTIPVPVRATGKLFEV